MLLPSKVLIVARDIDVGTISMPYVNIFCCNKTQEDKAMCCNFVIRELNRGAVINNMHDPSGKSRPMILLTDVRANDITNYGMTTNALQIQSLCYNRFELPIRIKWEHECKPCFIATLHTLQFTHTELLQGDVEFVGIVPKDILDMACRIYSTYISGNLRELDQLALEVKNLRVQFLRVHKDIPYIDYRDATGGTIRLTADGKEIRVVAGKGRELMTSNDGVYLIGRDVPRIPTTTASNHNADSSGVTNKTKPEDKAPAKKAVTKRDTTKKNIPLKKSTKKKDRLIGWAPHIDITKQTNSCLMKFLRSMDTMKMVDIAKAMDCPVNTAYNRRRVCIDELYRRYDVGRIKMTDSELEILLKFGGGSGSSGIVTYIKEVCWWDYFHGKSSFLHLESHFSKVCFLEINYFYG